MLLIEAKRKRNEELLSRVQHLERENAELRQAALNPQVLESQLQQLMNPSRSAYHGPDTVAHLECFSIDGIISDFRTHCPDVFELFNLLGRADRCDDPSNTRVTRLKAVMSLLTTLKCRSVKVLGIQLLLTFTLIARAKNKKVKENNIINTLNNSPATYLGTCMYMYFYGFTVINNRIKVCRQCTCIYAT